MYELVLHGCEPTPLASYLKALGVLRVVSEQADSAARGWWTEDRFCLRTTLDRAGLEKFLSVDYGPTPIIAPWNGGSGFFPKDARDAIAALRMSAEPRFAKYRDAIALGDHLIRKARLNERPTDSAKAELISALRASGSQELVSWIDAAVALTLEKAAFPPLLGTGGNDGRLDFTNNFMQRLTELMPPGGDGPSRSCQAMLSAALFANPAPGLLSVAVGQFAPGAAGGPNSSAGFQGDSKVNAWDFVLMLEGAIAFAGGVSRRLEGANAAAFLSYPFTVRATAAGFGSASLDEQGESRGELWAPIWERPTSYLELRALFREGRLSVGARPARDGLDAARAVSALGADRRISAYQRYGFVKRQGLAYLATPLGRRRVRANSSSELLDELARDRWLDRLRAKAASQEGSADLRSSVRRLEDASFAVLERPGAPSVAQDLLVAFGAAVRVIATRPKLQDDLRPPQLLSRAWIEAADKRDVEVDTEFRLALALANMRAQLSQADETASSDVTDLSPRARFVLPMRAHLAPLAPDSGMRPPAWSLEAGRNAAVWGAGDLVTNLCAVANRRILESRRDSWPAGIMFDGRACVSSGDVANFLNKSVDDRRISDLVLGLAWMQPISWSPASRVLGVPFAYAAIKPIFAPNRMNHNRSEGGRIDLPMPSMLPALLIAGRVPDAVRLAQERARSSGLHTPFLDRPSLFAPFREADTAFGRRLLAALTIPVMPGVIAACIEQAYPSSD